MSISTSVHSPTDRVTGAGSTPPCVYSSTTSLQALGRRVRDLCAEHDLDAPDDASVEAIVEATLQARSLYLIAALEEPSQLQLAVFLDRFFLICLFTSNSPIGLQVAVGAVLDTQDRHVPSNPILD